MTQAQAATMATAYERAAIQGVHIVGHGTRRDGRAVYAVSSASDATRAYLVAVVGARLVCPCGYAGDPTRECTCSPGTIARYQKRLSGPLLDRIDIHYVSRSSASPAQIRHPLAS